MARRGAPGWRGSLAKAMSRSVVLKLPYYFYAISMALYGVRRSDPPPRR